MCNGLYVHACMCALLSVDVCVHVCTPLCVHVCMCAPLFLCMCVHPSLWTYVCMILCVHVCALLFVCMHVCVHPYFCTCFAPLFVYMYGLYLPLCMHVCIPLCVHVGARGWPFETQSFTEPGAHVLASECQGSSCVLPSAEVAGTPPHPILHGCWRSEIGSSGSHHKYWASSLPQYGFLKQKMSEMSIWGQHWLCYSRE